MKIYIHKTNQNAYGPRKNTALWTSGCSIQCKGCFNPELFDGSLGKSVTPLYLLKVVRIGRKLGDTGLAVVGGEPFDQAFQLAIGLLLIRIFYPKHKITLYSGYPYLNLIKRWQARLAILFADYLVDGPFTGGSTPDETLSYRGSENQRVINLKSIRNSNSLVFDDWDNRIVISGGEIAGPPHLMNILNPKNTVIEECGRPD